MAIATWYESYYGSAAARAVVYESPLFYATLFFLALNVAAVVISRYPWKRKHTGFIVTHVGIEVLLLGCLLDIRLSQEGRVAMRPGQSVETIDSTRDGLFVSWQSDGRARTQVVAMDAPWRDAGYPSIARFVASPVLGLPERPTWPAGRRVPHALGPGVTLELIDWLPAAKPRTRVEPRAGGNPAVELTLSGQTPAGMAVDDRLVLHSDEENGASGTLFGGVIEASLWRARAPEEASRFIAPIDVNQLPASGRLDLLIDGAWQSLDVAQSLNKPITLDAKTTATIDGYYPSARWDGTKLTTDGDAPHDPMVQLTLTRGEAKATLVVAARAPYLTGPLASVPAAFGAVPVARLEHPAMLKTDPAGVRGRLELLAADDGRLLFRRCGLRGVEASGELARGANVPAWMGLSLGLSQYESSGTLSAGFVASDVAAKDLSDSMRAARVALSVDGTTRELSVARGAAAQTVKTPRGDVTVQYGFDAIDLPASLTLKAARMGRDPGTDRAASYESDVAVQQTDGRHYDAHITMNEPLTVAGRTFYQSGFDERGAGGPISVLSMRYDPGRPVKYAGCGLIVLGIFLMFYMKAYFQKPRAATVPAAATREQERQPIGALGVQA